MNIHSSIYIFIYLSISSLFHMFRPDLHEHITNVSVDTVGTGIYNSAVFYLSILSSVHTFINLSIYLSIYQSNQHCRPDLHEHITNVSVDTVGTGIYNSAVFYLSIYLSIYLSLSLSIYLSIYFLFIYSSLHLSIYSSYQTIHLFIS